MARDFEGVSQLSTRATGRAIDVWMPFVSANAAKMPFAGTSALVIEGLTAFYRSLAGVGPHVSERARPGCQRHPTRTAPTEGGLRGRDEIRQINRKEGATRATAWASLRRR
jgi:hypothetical protein